MKRVAIIGTQGVPASYGGFESLVENIIGFNDHNRFEYTVFCSSKDLPGKMPEYKGARLKYVPLHANGVQSIPYDIVSMMRCVCKYDTILILGISGCIFLPILKLFCRKRIIVNIDGLEHRRSKWKNWVRRYLRFSEKMAVRFADTIIADNKGIQNYVTETYGKPSVLITYGGDHALIDVCEKRQMEILAKYGVEKDGYAISVCRIEPENNCHITLEAFAGTNEKLIFIGNWHRNGYSIKLKEQYGNGQYSNIKLLDSIYDLEELCALRNNARCYIHGHSAGGTNPSLVEAMHFGRPLLAFDVVYNRETTAGEAGYFSNADELKRMITALPDNGKQLQQVARERYVWKRIAKEYEALY